MPHRRPPRAPFHHIAGCVLACCIGACGERTPPQAGAPRAAVASAPRAASVAITGDDSLADALTWQPPAVDVNAEGVELALQRADAAAVRGDLDADAGSAIPLYLGVLRIAPGNAEATRGLAATLPPLLARGDAALEAAGDDIEALRTVHHVAAVARVVAAGDAATLGYLARVDRADRAWGLNRGAERDLEAGRLGEDGERGAWQQAAEALAVLPGQPRALQNLAAVESELLRRAEEAAAGGDILAAARWVGVASLVRADSPALDPARAWLERQRQARVAALRDAGLQQAQAGAVQQARRQLQALREVARGDDPALKLLADRIELAARYGMFRPGQQFTDALKTGGRGPRMVVLPHGRFAMGAGVADGQGEDSERPVRDIRFERGFALSAHEVTVAEFARYIAATGAQTRAERRSYAMAYDERSGNFVRRSGVNWRHDYVGRPAGDGLPVLYLSARDAEGYAAWLSAQTGHRYRLPSEAEFEYASRAGTVGVYPWGTDAPPAGVGNLTGGLDRSPGGRTWGNAFPGYGDGAWGPAPVGSYRANAYGLHDMEGNVSEWVADCWHASFRRAPTDGSAWVNPGCRSRVLRGGSWSSSPRQTRAAWRGPAGEDTTNARAGFRLAREL